MKTHSRTTSTAHKRSVLVCAAAALVLFLAAVATQAGTLTEPCLVQSAILTVDSTASWYATTSLTNRAWYAKGEEDPNDWTSTRMGNSENTWISGDTLDGHWIAFEWPQPVTLDEVEICWSLAELSPRAFRVERFADGRWVPAADHDAWLVPTDRQTVLPLGKTETRKLRICQPPEGNNPRRVMGAQEVMVFHREGKTRPFSGARRLPPEAFARLKPRPMMLNLARLGDECPEAATPLEWLANGGARPAPALADGNLETPALALAAKHSAGVQWPVRHALDRVALVFAQTPPEVSSLVLEGADYNRQWVPIKAGLASQALPAQRRIEWTCEPTVTHAVRVRYAGKGKVPIAEMEVFRSMPKDGKLWPARLTEKAGLKQELLAAPAEPSFEALALNAHSLQASRAFVGLKDDPTETGVGWEGSLIARETIRFRLGREQYTFEDTPDTVRRTLIDGWRPGVVVAGRMGDLEVKETVLAVPVGAKARPVAVVRLAVGNRSAKPWDGYVEASASGERPGVLAYQNGMISRGRDLILLSMSPAAAGDTPDAMRVSFSLAPGEERHLDFCHPQGTNLTSAEIAALRATMTFDKALRDFRQYWDGLMATPTLLEVPEPRVNRAVKAVLAQSFVCGDSNIMHYGVAPSTYEGGNFGYEESFPMLGLAMFGYGPDAQRYMEGAYLTRDFLKKIETYSVKEVDSRHQQYRNGLQPHYAVSLYRLTRDDAWMRRHLPLLKECAEWTLSQRRRTMELENGLKPLHWGLLPKWAYGGDILEVLCYPLLPNYCCWRGLTDTAWTLDQFNDQATAQRYRDDAREYRVAIDRAVEGSYLKDAAPLPFLPLKVAGTNADEQLDFYQLFAGMILDVEPFEKGSRHARWIADYMEESNRLFCHLPRFRHLGPGALDAIYGKGYFLTLLHEDAVRDFVLSFYAYLAFNLEHDTFVSRESNVLYPGDQHPLSPFHAGAFPAAEVTDPLVCGSAVILHLVRHALVTEERGAPGDYSGSLLLLAGTPRAWLEDGKQIRLRETPTHFGPMSLEVRSKAGQGRIEAALTPPKRNPCQRIMLRFRHPEGKPMQAAKVNGKPWRDFDPAKEWIRLPGDLGPCKVEARY